MKNITIRTTVLSLALGAANLAHSAVAISSLTNPTEITTGSSATVNYIAGYDVTVGSSSIWVTALGYYDPGGDGLEDPNALVGIYTTDGLNGTLLDSVAAGSTASSFIGDYRFIELATPFQLEANTTYRVAANTGNVGGSNHNLTPNGGTATAGGSELTIETDEAYAATNPGLVRPSPGPGLPFIYLGNFQYSTTIPEPSVALLGVLSLGGLLRRRR